MSDLGALIKQARIDCEMSQTDLAQAVGFKSATALSLIEANKRKVSVTVLQQIAFATGKDVSFFLQEDVKRLYPVYKQVKMMMPHCPRCGEQLRGNNSIVTPWECACGTWRCEFGDPLNYTICEKEKAASKKPAA